MSPQITNFRSISGSEDKSIYRIHVYFSEVSSPLSYSAYYQITGDFIPGSGAIQEELISATDRLGT